MKRPPFLTVALILACVVVAWVSKLGFDEAVLRSLFIKSPGSIGLEEIGSGEVWRLLTPAFIHFGPFHLLFNVMWLWDLGRIIEKQRGRLFLATFVLVIGIAANVVQYVLTFQPAFGGMSGVVYGMLGYIWMRARAGDVGYELRLHDVVTSVAWFFLCWSGLIGPIANWAHTAGLVGGLAWGFIETASARRAKPTTRVGHLLRPSVLSGAIGTVTVLAVVVLLAGLQAIELEGRCAVDADLDRRISSCSAIVRDPFAPVDPRSQALVDRGNAHRTKGQPDLARGDYEAAIKLNPANAKAFLGRGLMRRAEGNRVESDADIARAAAIDASVVKDSRALQYWQFRDEAMVGVDAQDAAAIAIATRAVVRRMLQMLPPESPSEGVLDARFVSFRTDADGVQIPPQLRRRFPDQMTIVLQHQYRELMVTPQTLVVGLRFDGQWETLFIPFAAMTAFNDPSATFSIGLGAGAVKQAEKSPQ